MPDTTLVTYAKARRDAARGERKAARGRLGPASTAMRAARDALRAARKAHAERSEELEAVRKDLGSAATPPDGTATSQKLEDALVAHRLSGAAKLERALALLDAEQKLSAEQTALARASVAVSEAESRLVDANGDQLARERLLQQLAEGPASTVRARAQAAHSGPKLQAARQRVESAFPKELRDRHAAAVELRGARETVARERLRRAADRLDVVGGKSGDSGAHRRRSRRAHRARRTDLGRYVSESAGQLQAALLVVERLAADPAPALLSAPQEAALKAPTDDQKAAAQAATALDSAEAVLLKAELRARTLELDAEVAGEDPDSREDVTAAREALAQARSSRDSAKAAFSGEVREALWRWQAAAPEEAWRELDAFERARAAIDALRQLDPASLTTGLTQAEAHVIADSNLELGAAALQRRFEADVDTARRELEACELRES